MDRRLWTIFGFLICGLIAATPATAAEPDPQVVSVLQHWETTSQARSRDGLSVRTLQPFLGRITEGSLLQRYIWTRRSDTELEAVPTDPTERQFSPLVKIVVDDEGLPQSIATGQLRQSVSDLVRAEIARVASRESSESNNGIVRVSFTTNGETQPGQVEDSRIRDIITRWAEASVSAKGVQASFHRVDYDIVTEVETHATGKFVFQAPYQGEYMSQPSPPRGATAGARIGLNGQRYVRLEGEPVWLVWTGKELIQIESAARRYTIHANPGTPREIWAAGSVDVSWQALIAPQSALPLVVALEAKSLLSIYKWNVVGNDAKSIILRGTPVDGPEAVLYSSVQVVIDPTTFRTQATRIVDAAGSKETIHEFQYRVVSKDAAALGEWLPDLAQFERVGDVPGVEAVPSTRETQPASPADPVE